MIIFSGNLFFEASFSEGNNLSTLEVVAKGPVDVLENSEELRSKAMSDEQFSYYLASTNFLNLSRIENIVRNQKNITSIQIQK